jgi:flagellar biosynthesis/type III secretory pathway chaperone
LRLAVDNKSHCVEALRTLEDQRRDTCASAGFEPGDEQMEQVIDWCDDGLVLANGWQHLLDIAVECNAMNLTNGSIIRSRKQQIENSLAVIRGGAPEAGLYSRDGHGANGSGQRSLAEA